MPIAYPVFFQMQGRVCLVAGGGAVGWRKARGLLESGARVVVVSPEGIEPIQEAARAGKLEWKEREFSEADLEGCFLVFAATDNPDVNQWIADLCRQRDLLVNVADDPETSDFWTAARATQGDLTIAVSTGGKVPALSARVRRQLEHWLREEYGECVEFLAECRRQVKELEPDSGKRSRLLKKIVNSEVIELLKNHQKVKAQRLLGRLMEEGTEDDSAGD
jgi:precorrin-2 dehydrogenase / sirohydrochlorin ferrochelatase